MVKRETFSDEWVEKTFRGIIEEAVHDFPEIEGVPNDEGWYLERVTLLDMRKILSHLLLNEQIKVREYVYKYLSEVEAEEE